MLILIIIYNSRNYYKLLNDFKNPSTGEIYNSRNYYKLLNHHSGEWLSHIYNSRNYYKLLNSEWQSRPWKSTIVEIIISYSTKNEELEKAKSTIVEIIISYSTKIFFRTCTRIYNSRNYYKLLNSYIVILHYLLICRSWFLIHFCSLYT